MLAFLCRMHKKTLGARKLEQSETAIIMLVKYRAKKNRIARPMNSFMVFAQEYRAQLRSTHPDIDNKVISKMLGQKWKQLTPPERQRYIDQAAQIAEQHKKDHPDWKFVRSPPRKKPKTPKEMMAASDNSVRTHGVQQQVVATDSTVPPLESILQQPPTGMPGVPGGGDMSINPIVAAYAAATMATSGAAVPLHEAARILFGTNAATAVLMQHLHQQQQQQVLQGEEAVSQQPPQLPPPSYVPPPPVDHMH